MKSITIVGTARTKGEALACFREAMMEARCVPLVAGAGICTFHDAAKPWVREKTTCR